MIIDPYRKGVYIFTDSNVTSLKGENVPWICEEIYKRVVAPTKRVDGRIEYVQLYELYIDTGGIGIEYKRILEDMGLLVHDIKYRHINTILPIRTEYIPHRVVMFESDRRPIFI